MVEVLKVVFSGKECLKNCCLLVMNVDAEIVVNVDFAVQRLAQAQARLMMSAPIVWRLVGVLAAAASAQQLSAGHCSLHKRLGNSQLRFYRVSVDRSELFKRSLPPTAHALRWWFERLAVES